MLRVEREWKDERGERGEGRGERGERGEGEGERGVLREKREVERGRGGRGEAREERRGKRGGGGHSECIITLFLQKRHLPITSLRSRIITSSIYLHIAGAKG